MPGKPVVAPKSGTPQAFHVADDAKFLDAAANCASNGDIITVGSTGYGAPPCTDAELAKAPCRCVCR